MIEKTIDIETPDGKMETFAVRPEGDGPFPAVILYMDAPGIRNELRDFCRRMAGEGYYAMLPDMYYRIGFRMTRFDDQGMKEMFGAMRSLNNELVMRDTGAMLSFLESEDAVATGPKGCIGYCMSGQYVVSAAGCYPDDFHAAASLYGVGIVTQQSDSPHLLADKMKGELYLGFAETDEYVEDNVIPDLRTALDANNVDYRLDVWPGTHHGFCFPERGAAYHEASAEQVWELVFDLFKRKLAS
jgi:carboxymethylenebutenolidase